MNKTLNIIIISIHLVLLATTGIKAQEFEAGFLLGGANYSGDLTENASASIRQTRPAAGVLIRYSLNPYLGVRAQFLGLRLEASDALSEQEWKIRRNLSFYTNVQDFDFLFDLNPLAFFIAPGRWTPLLTGGFSIFRFDPMRNFEGQEVRLVSLGSEGQGLPGRPPFYRLHSTALSFGGSINYQIHANWSVFAEVIWRSARTDYLDDVSGKYADYDLLLSNRGRTAAEIGNGIKAPAGSQRGNARDNDWFQTLMLGIHYKLFDIGSSDSHRKRKSTRLRCPKF